ncbi:MAG: ABC transporter permease, partial [Verrucomicrobia bacterium]|nr:ABC transporter permease [Verrucomicrobiota bacterium]
VLTAFMVTGRVGAAMCAELGTMQVSEQIDALRSMAVNPLRYLVAPRFIAGTLMMPPLTVFSMVMGILGGYAISVYFFGMSPQTYLDPMPIHIKDFDLISGLSKSVMFGIIIVTIACYKGLNTRGGAAGVGFATTSSVVISYSLILFSNFFLNIILNTLYRTYWPWR